MTTSTLKMATPAVSPAGHEFLVRELNLGTNYLHAGLVSQALKLDLPEPPECPFGKEEAKAIHARGNQIIWLPSHDLNGEPITMKRLYNYLENKAPMGGKILLSPDWYDPEEFYTSHTARVAENGLGLWREVGKTAIPGTKGKNALRRTIIATEYVERVVFGGNPPKHLKDILGEPAKREAEIARLMNDDSWPEANRILSELSFNRLFCDTPVEAMLRVVVNQRVNKIRLLEGDYSVTSTLSRGSDLVGFCDAVLAGARVNGWFPWDACGLIGFFLSRSECGENEV